MSKDDTQTVYEFEVHVPSTVEVMWNHETNESTVFVDGVHRDDIDSKFFDSEEDLQENIEELLPHLFDEFIIPLEEDDEEETKE